MAEINRYSTIVTWAKVTLPLVALGLLSTLFLFSHTPDPEAALPYSDVDVEEIARSQRLTEPRFAGTMEDGREVTFVAHSVGPVSGATNTVELVDVEGRIEIAENDFLALSAGAALVDITNETVELRDNVQLNGPDGYYLHTTILSASLQDLRITAPGFVTITGPEIDLQANTLSITDTGETLLLSFTGDVRVLYRSGE